MKIGNSLLGHVKHVALAAEKQPFDACRIAIKFLASLKTAKNSGVQRGATPAPQFKEYDIASFRTVERMTRGAKGAAPKPPTLQTQLSQQAPRLSSPVRPPLPLVLQNKTSSQQLQSNGTIFTAAQGFVDSHPNAFGATGAHEALAADESGSINPDHQQRRSIFAAAVQSFSLPEEERDMGMLAKARELFAQDMLILNSRPGPDILLGNAFNRTAKIDLPGPLFESMTLHPEEAEYDEVDRVTTKPARPEPPALSALLRSALKVRAERAREAVAEKSGDDGSSMA